MVKNVKVLRVFMTENPEKATLYAVGGLKGLLTPATVALRQLLRPSLIKIWQDTLIELISLLLENP